MVILGTFTPPENPILCQNDNTKAIINGTDLGNGTVFVNERKLFWKNEQNSGFAVAFPHISLHAITTDPNVYHSKCLFIMIDNPTSIQGYEFHNPSTSNGGTESESESDCELEDNPSQLLLVPSDLNTINTIFTALSQGQSLNPDPQDSIEEEEDDDMYDDAEDFYDEMHHGDGGINHLSLQLQNNSIQNAQPNGDYEIDDNQFEDVD